MQTLQPTDSNVAELLQTGSVGVLPTDTIYGVVAQASNPEAVARLYQLKHREGKPGTIIAANIDQLVYLGIPRRYLTAVEQFWPGPVSIILPTDNNLEYLHLGKQSLACRIPDNATVQTWLQHTGPLLTSSANDPGQQPATTIKEAQAYFGDKVDFYVDGGSLADHKPSTIIRLIDDAIEVVRQGAVTIDESTGEVVNEL